MRQPLWGQAPRRRTRGKFAHKATKGVGGKGHSGGGIAEISFVAEEVKTGDAAHLETWKLGGPAGTHR